MWVEGCPWSGLLWTPFLPTTKTRTLRSYGCELPTGRVRPGVSKRGKGSLDVPTHHLMAGTTLLNGTTGKAVVPGGC